MTAPPGNYPAVQSAGMAVIPLSHQMILSAQWREATKAVIPARGGVYPEWPNRGRIAITNPVSLANFQHAITLPWVPGMRFDFSDIRFAQQNDVICPYWIESYASKSSAKIWIKIPSANQRQIFIYYGNSQAASGSDGAAVFELFDDFQGSAYNTEIWDKTGSPTISVTGGALDIKTTGANQYLSSKKSFGVDTIYMARTRTYISSTSQVLVPHGYGGYNGNNSPTASFILYTQKYMCGAVYNNSTGTLTTQWPHSATYKRFEIYRRGSTNVEFYEDGSSKGIKTSYLPTGDLPIIIGNVAWASGYTWRSLFDWIAVRKYAATDPTCTLREYGPRPGLQTIYYPFSPAPISTCFVLKHSEWIEFSQTAVFGTPIASLHLQPVVPFSTTQAVKVATRMYIDLTAVLLERVRVKKSIQDTLWTATFNLDQYKAIDTTALRNVIYSTTDYLGTSRALFTGILPASSPQVMAADTTTTITGYDYAWYLTMRKVPAAYLHNTATTNPATIILGLLGGDDWLTEIGIEPYSIQTVAEWGTTLNTRVFDFTRTTSRWQAIQKICNYCRYVFVVKFRTVSGIVIPSAYFCHEDDIDTYLDLPAPVTITKPTPFVDGAIKWNVKGEERYNQVTVYGRDPTTGLSVYYTASTAGVLNGDETPIEYVESSGAFTTLTQVTARAIELLAYFQVPAITYTVKLVDRVDIELYQQIKFSGWAEIPAEWMRVISVDHDIESVANKTTTIQITPTAKFSQVRKMYRSMNPDPTSEMEAMFNAKAASMVRNEMGVVIAVDESIGEATVKLDDGRTVTARSR